MYMYMCFIDYMYMLGKVTAGVLCCFALFVCLTLLASFFLPSHLSFKKHVCIPQGKGELIFFNRDLKKVHQLPMSDSVSSTSCF